MSSETHLWGNPAVRYVFCLLLYLLSECGTATSITDHENAPFDVTVNRRVPLGLILENMLTIGGFQTKSDSGKIETYFSASSGILKPGDRLIKLNGIDITGWNVIEFSMALKSTPVPYSLTVLPVDGSDRNLFAPVSRAEYLGLKDWRIKLVVLMGGLQVTSTDITGRVAQFNGKNATCRFSEIVDAGTGCTSNGPRLWMKESTAGSGKARKYTSPERFEERTSSDILNRHIKKEGVDGVKNKVLIVDRGGGCSFFDKAMRAAEAGAVGLLVTNSDDTVFEMETDAADYDSVLRGLPVVMISKHDGDVVRRYLIHEAVKRGGVLHTQLSDALHCIKRLREDAPPIPKSEQLEKSTTLQKHREKLGLINDNKSAGGKKYPASLVERPMILKDHTPVENTVSNMDESKPTLHSEDILRKAKFIATEHIYRHQFPDAHDIAASSVVRRGVDRINSIAGSHSEEMNRRKEHDTYLKNALRWKHAAEKAKETDQTIHDHKEEWMIVVGPKGILRNITNNSKKNETVAQTSVEIKGGTDTAAGFNLLGTHADIANKVTVSGRQKRRVSMDRVVPVLSTDWKKQKHHDEL